MTKPIVTVNNWGRRGWRVSLYQPADIKTQGWNAMGRRLYEEFKRTEASARKLAAQLARDNEAAVIGAAGIPCAKCEYPNGCRSLGHCSAASRQT